ncbi:MAG: hypothetical protein KA536_23565 [Saprospiraceae bacterium]|jgi:hypothetical protein|nr:hypothetical protein [Saprospiraceae bacterium]
MSHFYKIFIALINIKETIEKGMNDLGMASFTISLSLTQVTIGILLSEKIINNVDDKSSYFLISDIFSNIFPKIKGNDMNKFVGNSA